MASKLASGLAFVLVGVLVCAAMFDVPSALVVSRGYSPWLALVVVTVLAVARGQVWTAMRDHGLWFVPGRAVRFAGDPPPLGSHAMCEAFATMEVKCENGESFKTMVAACKMVKDFDRDNAVGFTSNISVAEQCAIKTSSCDDYHECEYGHD